MIVVVGLRTRALAVRLEQAAQPRLAGSAGPATRVAGPAAGLTTEVPGPAAATAVRWMCTAVEAA